jgi:hypothetical protein
MHDSFFLPISQLNWIYLNRQMGKLLPLFSLKSILWTKPSNVAIESIMDWMQHKKSNIRCNHFVEIVLFQELFFQMKQTNKQDNRWKNLVWTLGNRDFMKSNANSILSMAEWSTDAIILNHFRGGAIFTTDTREKCR